MAESSELNRVVVGDCRETLKALPAELFQCCVTSPPYWGLRDYGHVSQIGLEKTPEEYVAELVNVFREVRRVLRDDGTLWLNLGDSYAATTKGSGGHTAKQDSNAGSFHSERKWTIPPGIKPKDLVGIPWRVAFALQADGWWLRSDIIWSKPNPMPESVTDRATKAHEYVFLLAKSERYFFDAAAVREPGTGVAWNSARSTLAANGVKNVELCRTGQRRTAGADTFHADVDRTGRNARSVWTIPTAPYSGAHFATMPPKLAERCILAGSAMGTAVLDPFFGSGTTGEVAERLGRKWLGCELSEAYAPLAKQRTAQVGLPWPEAGAA